MQRVDSLSPGAGGICAQRAEEAAEGERSSGTESTVWKRHYRSHRTAHSGSCGGVEGELGREKNICVCVLCMSVIIMCYQCD